MSSEVPAGHSLKQRMLYLEESIAECIMKVIYDIKMTFSYLAVLESM